ncbi:unnamed protein product, partial [Rotaria magnacalcarata]
MQLPCRTASPSFTQPYDIRGDPELTTEDF